MVRNIVIRRYVEPLLCKEVLGTDKADACTAPSMCNEETINTERSIGAMSSCQCLSNCTPTPPLIQQQSTDNRLGLILG